MAPDELAIPGSDRRIKNKVICSVRIVEDMSMLTSWDDPGLNQPKIYTAIFLDCGGFGDRMQRQDNPRSMICFRAHSLLPLQRGGTGVLSRWPSRMQVFPVDLRRVKPCPMGAWEPRFRIKATARMVFAFFSSAMSAYWSLVIARLCICLYSSGTNSLVVHVCIVQLILQAPFRLV